MNENLDDVLNAHNDVVRIERLTHHIARIREDQHAMRAAIERMSEAVTRLGAAHADLENRRQRGRLVDTQQ